MTIAAAAAPRAGPANTLTNAVIIIVVGVIATTLAQPQVLARLPLTNLLKNELGIGRAETSAFFFWAGLAWYFKPLAGILTDAFPVFGSRRRSYLLASTSLAVLAWIGLLFTPHQYNALLWMCILINTFMVLASTVIGGYMVETAQASSGSGRLTAIRQFVQQCCLILNGPTAGYLASLAFGWTAGACGGVLFLLVPVTILYLHEQRKHVDTAQILRNASEQLGRIATARTMWAAAGLMALFYLAPGLSTATFFRQQNDLHMTTQGQGFLQFIYGIFGVCAAISYGLACRRFNLRTLLVVCLLTATAAQLTFLFYTSVANARMIAAIEGFGFTLAELALMDLAVRATPAGSEGLGFSLMISVRNLSLFGTDWFGSMLMDSYHLSYNSLVLANATTTLIAVPFIFLLPHILVRRREAEIYEEAPAPPTAIQD